MMPKTGPQRAGRSAGPGGVVGALALHGVIIVLAVVSLTPFFWLICATFKHQQDFFSYAFLPWAHPGRWTLSNYAWLFECWPFAAWMFNSLFLSCAHTCLVVTLSSLGGFALAKYRFKGASR